MLVKDYSAKGYDAEGEYKVDYIVAERQEGKRGKKKPKMEYLVKWKVSTHHANVLSCFICQLCLLDNAQQTRP